MIDLRYKRVSWQAVATLAISVCSLTALLNLQLAVFAVASIPCSLLALRAIRHYELGGSRLVFCSMCLSAATIWIAPVWHWGLYLWEAVPDCSRVNFSAVTGKDRHDLDRYENWRICLKGYALSSTAIRPQTILFSPDGDLADQSSAITVELPFRWEYDQAPLAISGTLKVNTSARPHDQRYRLEAVAIRSVQSQYGLVPRMPGKGC